MIEIEKTEVFGWKAAVRGMRNPMNSWDKSDSQWIGRDVFRIGPNDTELMTKLANGGSDDRKFMRMITVYLDITAPLYWWKEFDTYKVGTVANSCSTMHKIAAKEFTPEDFSMEHLYSDPEFHAIDVDGHSCMYSPACFIRMTCQMLNFYRSRYLVTKDKNDWWQMIQLLPSSYNQKRTVMLNYEVLTNMYHARKGHKLDEWHDFCDWIKGLPCSELITKED